MQQMPAACGHCGYLYPSGYYSDPGDTGIRVSPETLEVAKVTTPCPMCGRYRGTVLAHEYRLVEDAAALLQGPENPVEELNSLASLLREAREHDETAAETKTRADKQAPELCALVDKLLDDKPESMEDDTWSTLLLSTIDELAPTGGNGNADELLVPSEVIYNALNQYNITTVQVPPTAEAQQAERKVGRNDPCPCGSGKKYKKCHGSPTVGAGPA
jgi:hypothetical protein